MNSQSHYDVAIIGAGMSGLAAGIRLAHFGKRVCIFERHNAIGGLNSFYSINGRKFDVGLHAMTNYVAPGVKGTPLGKILRQLRIDREELQLHPQKRSRIAFGERGEVSLSFTNDFAVLRDEVRRVFPAQIDAFDRLTEHIRGYDGVALDAPVESARGVMKRFITDPLLEDMLFCPMMYYGSPQERDMAFRDFVVLFRSIFFEGFARPLEGVRLVLRVLLEKYRQAGGERRMKCGVRRIMVRDGKATALQLDSGEVVTAAHVISSVGAVETEKLYRDNWEADAAADIGRLSFVETVTVLDREPGELGWGDDTIVFFSACVPFTYERPEDEVDVRSGVICIPNNFAFPAGQRLPEGVVRCTCLANYDAWSRMEETQYREAKHRWYIAIADSVQRFLPALADRSLFARCTVATDMFTPRTIERFTGHLGGAVYGSPKKNRSGKTSLSNLYLCGTDQGYLGIIGSMLSGISMANLHVLQKS
jgi:phytoene dehydrogenase-like protein